MAKCGNGYQMTLSWIPDRNGHVPPSAIDAGGGIYVCRAQHGSEMVSGKLVPKYGKAYIPWGGKEHELTEYEVLCDTSINCGPTYYWAHAADGAVPNGAVVASVSGDRKPVYIARVNAFGEMLVGKVHAGHRSAYFPYGGLEKSESQYEVLVWKKE